MYRSILNKSIKSNFYMQTINDVLFGVISSGLSKYLDIQSPEGELSFSIQGNYRIY